MSSTLHDIKGHVLLVKQEVFLATTSYGKN